MHWMEYGSIFTSQSLKDSGSKASLSMLASVACSSLNERLADWGVEGQWQDFEKVCIVGLNFEWPKSDIESGESSDGEDA